MNKVASISLKYGVCLAKQSKRKEKAGSMAIISSLYKAYGQKDKRCAERYTIFQPRIKSWTSTIIWDKYNVIFFFGKLCSLSGTLWCSRIWNSILSHRGQSLTLNECCSAECTNQTVSWNIHKIKNNTDIRACSLSVNQMRTSFVTTATAEHSFRIILGPIQLILK